MAVIESDETRSEILLVQGEASSNARITERRNAGLKFRGFIGTS